MQEKCDRCGNSLNGMSIMSWFTTEIICNDCSKKDRDIRFTLPNHGFDYEACGFIPIVTLDNEEKK